MLLGEKVYLAPLEKSDSDKFFEWINNRSLVIKNSNYKPIDKVLHENWFNSIVKNETVRIFAIRKKDDEMLIGSCQLYSIDWINSSAELQIRIGAEGERGQGLGTETVRVLLSYAFKDLNLHRVYLHVYENNLPAIKTYEKTGFTREGILREANFIDGEYVNIILMSVLRQEWLK